MKPIYIPLRYSYSLTWILVSGGVFLCVMLWLAPLPRAVQIVVSSVVLGLVGYHLMRDAWLQLSQSWRLIEVESSGEVILHRREMQSVKCRVVDAVVHRAMMLLTLESASAGQTGIQLFSAWRNQHRVILMHDHADVDSLRRLRVWLRWRHLEKSSAR